MYERKHLERNTNVEMQSTALRHKMLKKKFLEDYSLLAKEFQSRAPQMTLAPVTTTATATNPMNKKMLKELEDDNGFYINSWGLRNEIAG